MRRPVDLADYVEHFRARVLQDALNEATAAYWLRRAETFEWACSRPGDLLGPHTTPAQRAARDQEKRAIAAACRHRASLAPLQTQPAADVWAALADAERPTWPDAA